MKPRCRHLWQIERDGGLLRVGDVLPLPKEKLSIRPASRADDPARGPSGVFRNGRGRT